MLGARTSLLNHAFQTCVLNKAGNKGGEGRWIAAFLAGTFDFQSVRIFGKRYVLEMEKGSWDAGSSREYERKCKVT